MKNVIMILVAVVTFGLNTVSANETELIKNNSSEAQMELNIFPYAKADFTPMTSVFSFDEYTVYKVESTFVDNLPSCNPVGGEFHYFIYKDGKFHMTVTECNKEDVFDYLTQQ